MRFWIAEDDRPKLALISSAQDVRPEGNSFGQLRDILAIDGTIAREFGQCQIGLRSARRRDDDVRQPKRARESTARANAEDHRELEVVEL